MAYLHVILITMLEIDTAADVYLELFQTYRLKLFWEKKRFNEKGSILDGIVRTIQRYALQLQG